MSAHEALHRALGRLAELLVAESTCVELNEVRDLLEELRRESYREGHEDGRTQRDEEENEAAERASRLFDTDPGSGE